MGARHLLLAMSDLPTRFEELHGRLAEALLACRADADARSVHALRTTTRRIEALLQKVLTEHPRAAKLDRRIEKALRQLKKVRKAAGPVRDIDVQRKLCAEIVEEVVKRRSEGEKKAVRDEGAKLDKFLRRQRRDCAKDVGETLREVEVKLERALTRAGAALVNVDGISMLKTAKQLVVEGSSAHESGEDLHSLRKRMKAPRYLAEMQDTSRVAVTMAKDLKKVLDDIGRWHDLMLLEDATKSVLGKRSVLTVDIARELDVSLRKAKRSAARYE